MIDDDMISISIHALLAESDLEEITWISMLQFLSTLSLRRATTTANEALQKVKISIHALLAESDGLGHGLHCLGGISIHALLAESDHPKL